MLGIGKNNVGRLFDAKIRVFYLVKSSGWVLIERWGKNEKKEKIRERTISEIIIQHAGSNGIGIHSQFLSFRLG